MFDEFFLLKLHRAVWIAYFSDDKIAEAINYYELYHNMLTNYSYNNTQIQTEISQEILKSEHIYLNQLEKHLTKYIDEKDFTNALLCCHAYFKLNQENAKVLESYITCLAHFEQNDLQIELIKYLQNLDEITPLFNKNIAQTYANLGNYEQAIQFFEKYIMAVDSVTADDYNLLGCYYNSLYSSIPSKIEYAQKSLEAFKKAVLMRTDPVIIKNITIMASKCNEYETAKYYWAELFKIKELSNDDKYDYSAFCLKNKDFDGWSKYFDARFLKENNKTAFPNINKPKWNGAKDLSKSTLLVYYEQGFGDSILMFGYLPRLVKKTKHIIYVVQNELYPLLKDNKYGIEVLPASIDISKIKFDYYIPSMSIPTVLRYGIDDISVGEGFISANKSLVEEFRLKYFNNNKFKIGISCSGNTTGDRTRDIQIEDLLPLDDLKNVELYCLTKNMDNENFSAFKSNPIINIAKNFNNFADTAAAITNLDIVISTDNCILNLAGALGKKTFGLFNWHNQFRWFDLTGDNTVWLTSVKPFVNEQMCVWDKSIDKIIREIEENIREGNYV